MSLRGIFSALTSFLSIVPFCRSRNYGHTFLNETYKLDNDTVIEWYYISPRQNNVSLVHTSHDSHMMVT